MCLQSPARVALIAQPGGSDAAKQMFPANLTWPGLSSRAASQAAPAQGQSQHCCNAIHVGMISHKTLSGSGAGAQNDPLPPHLTAAAYLTQSGSPTVEAYLVYTALLSASHSKRALPTHLVCAALLAQSGSPTAGAAAALRSWPRARSRSEVLCRCARAPLSSSGRANSSSTASWRSEICAMLCRPSGRHSQLRSRRRPPADNRCCNLACWGHASAFCISLPDMFPLLRGPMLPNVNSLMGDGGCRAGHARQHSQM